MQKIRYINPLGKEVVFSKSPPFILERVSGTGVPEVQLLTDEPVGQHGKSFYGLYALDREISVSIHIEGSPIKELYKRREELCALLNPIYHEDGALGRLEYTNDFGTWWIPVAVKRGPQDFNRTGIFFKSIPLLFYAPDCLWRDMHTEYASMAYLGGGLRFPVRFGAVRFGARGYKASIYNTGDSPSPLVIDITGPSTQPEIRKVSTGEYMRVGRQLYEGDILHIDMTPGHRNVTIQRAGGAVESGFGYIDISIKKWFLLDPGDNELEYLSGDDSQASTIILSTVGRFGGV